MPAAQDRYYTREEVLALPDDGNRYELVHGELLVSPSPRIPHQRVLSRVHLAIAKYLEQYSVGEVMWSPADISWGEETDDVLVQPDVFVVAPSDRGARSWKEVKHFLLFVEVLSPSTSRYDRFTKRRLYQEMRVPLYWIIDLDNRRAEVWTPDATSPIYDAGRLIWHPDGAHEALVIELAGLLAP